MGRLRGLCPGQGEILRCAQNHGKRGPPNRDCHTFSSQWQFLHRCHTRFYCRCVAQLLFLIARSLATKQAHCVVRFPSLAMTRDYAHSAPSLSHPTRYGVPLARSKGGSVVAKAFHNYAPNMVASTSPEKAGRICHLALCLSSLKRGRTIEYNGFEVYLEALETIGLAFDR